MTARRKAVLAAGICLTLAGGMVEAKQALLCQLKRVSGGT